MKVIIYSSDPKFKPIELEAYNWRHPQYIDINDKDLPGHLYSYAHNYVNYRWHVAEPIIIKDAIWAYLYARDVIRGRWKEAEEVIKKNYDAAYCYSLDVMHKRWLEAEAVIQENTNAWLAYRLHWGFK